MKQSIAMAWSGGKDSSLALHRLLHSDRYEVRCLLTTVNSEYGRISMHGVRNDLLAAQAVAIGLPSVRVEIPPACTNELYAERMGAALTELKVHGITAIAFGDIFLADVSRYREEQNASVGMGSIFPLWGERSADLIDEFLRLGFRTVTTCVDTEQLSDSFLGREIDRDFVAELPAGCDSCGENGEFHTFVFAGPLFAQAIRCHTGDRIQRGQFAFCDVLPE